MVTLGTIFTIAGLATWQGAGQREQHRVHWADFSTDAKLLILSENGIAAADTRTDTLIVISKRFKL